MNKRNTIILSYLFYFLVLIIHLFILIKIIPFQWINGGRSKSYDAQVPISIANIGVVFLGFLYVSINRKYTTIQNFLSFRIFKWSLVPFWCLSLFLQFIGTKFELFAMSPIVMLGIYSHIQLARIR